MKICSMGKKMIVIIIALLIVFGTISCSFGEVNGQNSDKGKKVELFLPKLSDSYGSVYYAWNELELDKIHLMEKPLLSSGDIEYMDDQILKVKKNFVVVDGNGLEDALIYDSKKDGVLQFVYEGKKYKVEKSSSKLFYNYTVYDICVVFDDDRIFLVKQVEFKKGSNGSAVLQREYKKGIIGIPYVLVVDGKRTELGVLKVDDAEFPVPEIYDSWCYMGLPDGLINRIPEENVLRKE